MTSNNDYSISYGKQKIKFDISQDKNVRKIETNSISVIEDFEAKIIEKLRSPKGTDPLEEIVSQEDNIAIVVSDITRLSYRTYDFLPVLIKELNRIGVKDSNVDIVIATGTHRPSTEEERVKILGADLNDRLDVHDHDSNSNNLVDLGETDRGTEIKVNPIVHEADKVILTGGIVYHTLAGFGGGRKSIAPGVISEKGIQQNHGLVLDENAEIDPRVGSGKLKNNPVSEDMFEIAEFVGADFILNVIVNGEKEFVDIVAGDLNEAYLDGCKKVEESFGISLENRSDLVIASCGGYPKDIQLYQSVKGLFNAAHAVKDDGVIILATECSQGIGPDKFRKWFENEDPKELAEELSKDFTISGFVALRTAKINHETPVILLSDLPDDEVRKLGMKPVKDMEEALRVSEKLKDNIDSVNLMPSSKLTFPIVSDDQKIGVDLE